MLKPTEFANMAGPPFAGESDKVIQAVGKSWRYTRLGFSIQDLG